MTDWQENARNRVKDNFVAGNYRALWETLSVPSNKVSREAFRRMSLDAPSVKANSGEWLMHLDALSGGSLREWLSHKADIDWKRKEDEALASGYPLCATGRIFPSAKAWLSHLRDTGWIVLQKGVGTLTFNHPDGYSIAPKRNKHLNAAYRLLESVQ